MSTQLVNKVTSVYDPRHTLMHLSAGSEEGEAVVEIQLPVARLNASPHFSSVSTAR